MILPSTTNKENNMKITFINKSTKQPQEFQEDYMIDNQGRVFKWDDSDFRGYGCWRVYDTYIEFTYSEVIDIN